MRSPATELQETKVSGSWPAQETRPMLERLEFLPGIWRNPDKAKKQEDVAAYATGYTFSRCIFRTIPIAPLR